MSWLGMTTILLDAARTIMGLAVNCLIQSTLLIAGGLAVGYLIRRRGSAVQSAVYRTALVAVLICPLVTSGLSLLGASGWSLQMPLAYSAVTAAPIESATKAMGVELTQNEVDSPSTFDAHASIPALPSTSDALLPTIANAHSELPQPIARAAPASFLENEPAVEATFHIHRFGRIAATADVLWFLAGICLLSRLAFSWCQLQRLRRGARSAEPSTIESCREIAAWLQVAPPDV